MFIQAMEEKNWDSFLKKIQKLADFSKLKKPEWMGDGVWATIKSMLCAETLNREMFDDDIILKIPAYVRMYIALYRNRNKNA